MQDLGTAFRGFIIAKAPFNRSSGLEDTNTYLPELVPPWSPLEVLRAAATFLSRGPTGPATRFAGGLTPGGGESHAHGARGP